MAEHTTFCLHSSSLSLNRRHENRRGFKTHRRLRIAHRHFWGSVQWDFTPCPPAGKQLRSQAYLQEYLSKNPDVLHDTIDTTVTLVYPWFKNMFSFSKWIWEGAFIFKI